MEIREEQARDIIAIDRVNHTAFGTRDEANLVSRLRSRSAISLSLVAEEEHEVIGHILFSPVMVGSNQHGLLGLGPMSVLPEHQHMGVGSLILKTGLERCRIMGYGAVVVLGNPGFYGKQGFTPASGFGLSCTYDAPDGAFMALELIPMVLKGCRGTVHYQPEFG